MEMMTGRTLFRNHKEYDQKEVEICGWVKSNRGSKKFGFLVINDGTFFEPMGTIIAVLIVAFVTAKTGVASDTKYRELKESTKKDQCKVHRNACIGC